MPLLEEEISLFPEALLTEAHQANAPADARWWAMYTLSRREKDFMRRLIPLDIAFYCPIAPHRYRSAAGRMRTSHLPLFSNYVFLFGTDDQRHLAMTTGAVSRYLPVEDGTRLWRDLARISHVLGAGVPVSPESRLEPGTAVRIKSGRFAGLEGVLFKRRGVSRILVAINFVQQGASFEMEDAEVEPV